MTLKAFIRAFSADNQLQLDEVFLAGIAASTTPFELQQHLYACWHENGLVDDAEGGCGAGSLLRPVVNNFLDMMGRGNWQIDSLIYDGQEESAQLVLASDNQQVTLNFQDFCGDWLPESALDTLQQFTHEQGQKTVAIFCSEDSQFLMLPLDRIAYQELQREITKYLSNFGYNHK